MEGFGEKKYTNQTNITFSRVHVYIIFCLPQNLVPFSHHPIPISHQLSCLEKDFIYDDDEGRGEGVSVRMRGGVRVLV